MKRAVSPTGPHPGRRRQLRRLFSCASPRTVADGLDVVTIRVEHEGAVVAGMIVSANARTAIVAAAGGDGRGIERLDECARAHAERDMNWRNVRFAARDPEVRHRRRAETRDIGAAGDGGRKLLDHLVTNGRERLGVERLALLEVTDVDTGVVNHCGTNSWGFCEPSPKKNLSISNSRRLRCAGSMGVSRYSLMSMTWCLTHCCQASFDTFSKMRFPSSPGYGGRSNPGASFLSNTH